MGKHGRPILQFLWHVACCVRRRSGASALKHKTKMAIGSENQQMKGGKHRFQGYVYSVMIGVGGNGILFVFLMSFLNVFAAMKFAPWILAFNAALTGYAFIDRNRHTFSRLKTGAAAAGLANVLLTCGMLVLLLSCFSAAFPVPPIDFVVFIVVGLVASQLGALLAIRFFRLKKE